MARYDELIYKLECYPHDYFDLAFDLPDVFQMLIDNAERKFDIFSADYYDEQMALRDFELQEIKDIQKAIIHEKITPTKASLFNQEVAKIKEALLWLDVKLDDRIEIVFWQDIFDPFVSFAKRTGRVTMKQILSIDADELKKARFGPTYIARITNTLEEWYERLIAVNYSKLSKRLFAFELGYDDYDDYDDDWLEDEDGFIDESVYDDYANEANLEDQTDQEDSYTEQIVSMFFTKENDNE